MPSRRLWIAVAVGVACCALGVAIAYKRQTLRSGALPAKPNISNTPENKVTAPPSSRRIEEIELPKIAGVPPELLKLYFAGLPEEMLDPEHFKYTIEDLKVHLEDLNGDGKPEYLIEECADSGNAGCDFTVYRKSGAGYVELLNDKELEVLKTKTNGYKDISSMWSLWAGDCGKTPKDYSRIYSVSRYRFNGKEYEKTSEREICWQMGSGKTVRR